MAGLRPSDSADQDAIVAYLRTIPPMKNQIPPPARLGFFAYMGAKFQMLIGRKDFPIVIFAGNAVRRARNQRAGVSAAVKEGMMKRILKWIAMAVVVVGVCGFAAFLYLFHRS